MLYCFKNNEKEELFDVAKSFEHFRLSDAFPQILQHLFSKNRDILLPNHDKIIRFITLSMDTALASHTIHFQILFIIPITLSQFLSYTEANITLYWIYTALRIFNSEAVLSHLCFHSISVLKGKASVLKGKANSFVEQAPICMCLFYYIDEICQDSL